MTVIRFKGFFISMISVLFYTTLPLAGLIAVTTLALTGTYFSSFTVFTLLLGLLTIRFIFCINLSGSVYMVTEAKVALERIQAFLKDQDATYEPTVENHEKRPLLVEQSGNLEDDLAVYYKITKENENYRKRDYPTNKNLKPFISGAVSVRNDDISFSNFYKVSSEAFIGQSTGGLNLSDQTSVPSGSQPFLCISDAKCSWSQSYLTDTLCGITLTIRKGEMLAITGAVGSGKSSLLTAILRELPLRKGTLSIHGKVAHVPQMPWVFSGTVRENILFGLPFHEERFKRVVHVCGLVKDLSDFARGDLTEIGQRGVSLSGGQKARVGLARAVYSNADIYLLDDPLSAVDTKVGRKLFDSCILGELSGRIRLLATHQLQYLKNVNRIAVIEKGSVAYQGSYNELKAKGAFGGIVELSSEPSENETEGAGSEGSNETLAQESSVVLAPIEEGQEDHDGKVTLCSDLELEKNLIIPPASERQELISNQELNGKGKIEETLNTPSISQESSENGHKTESFLGGPMLEKNFIICQEEGEESDDFENSRSRSLNKVGEKGKIEKTSDEPNMSPVSIEQGREKRSFSCDSDLEKSLVISQEELLLCERSGESLESVEEGNEKGIVELSSRSSPSPVFSEKRHADHDDNPPFMDVFDLPKLEGDDALVPEIVGLEAKNGPEADHRKVLDLKESEEHKTTGTVTLGLYWRYFKEGLSVPLLIFLAFLLIFAQGKVRQKKRIFMLSLGP